MRQTPKFLKLCLALLLTGATFAATRAESAEKKPAAKAAPAAPAAKAAEPAKAAAPARVIELAVTDSGFVPASVKVKQGEPLTLRVTRKTDATCATEITVPEYKLHAALPLNQPVDVSFTPTKAGQLKYGCAMGMMVGGTLVVE